MRGHFIKTFNNAATPAYQTAHWKKKNPRFFQLIKWFNLKYLSCSGKSQTPLLRLGTQARSGSLLFCTSASRLYSAVTGLVAIALMEHLLCAKHSSKLLAHNSERDKGATSPRGSCFESGNKIKIQLVYFRLDNNQVQNSTHPERNPLVLQLAP